MPRSGIIVVLASFFIWILPWGVFIKPSQEKMACGGQRAICLCHIAPVQAPDKPLEGVWFKGMTSTHKDHGGPGGGNYFLAGRSKADQGLRPASFFENWHFCYKSPYLASLEHVPKA